MSNIVWKLRPLASLQRIVTVGQIFSFEEIDKIKLLASNLKTEKGFVGRQGEKKEVRNCQVKWLKPEENHVWIYRRLVDVIQKTNSEYFNFNLYGLESLQYTIYDANDNEFYGPHRDVFMDETNGFFRKLTFSIQLSDPSEYEGGDLIIDVGFYPTTASKVLGDAIFFLPDAVHEAKPVTKGSRHVLVGWVSGPATV